MKEKAKFLFIICILCTYSSTTQRLNAAFGFMEKVYIFYCFYKNFIPFNLFYSDGYLTYVKGWIENDKKLSTKVIITNWVGWVNEKDFYLKNEPIELIYKGT